MEADFAIASLKLNPEKIIGVDISNKMLDVGKEKVISMNKADQIELQYGDSENLSFEDESFDAITVGFGVRNFETLDKGLGEMHRVLKNGGRVAVLEFSKPSVFPVKQVYNFYFSRILPWIGAKISKDKRAYTYLHESVEAFPEGKDFLDRLKSCGFNDVSQYKLLFGIASIYLAVK